jgi:hypothetical protein
VIAPGKPYEFAPRASDADDDALEFSVRNLPSWAHFDTTTGKLSGVPGPDDMGTYPSITISVSDGKSTTTFPAFSIVVERALAGSESAALKWHAPKENEDGSKIRDLAGFRIYYGQRASSLDYRVEIPSPHIKKASIEALQQGTWYFAVTAYTERGSESVLSEIVSKTID